MRRITRPLINDFLVVILLLLSLVSIVNGCFGLLLSYEHEQYVRGFESTAFRVPTRENNHVSVSPRVYMAVFQKNS